MRVALLAPEIPDYATEYSRIAAERCEVLLCISDRHAASVEAKPQLQVEQLHWPRLRELKNITFLWSLAEKIQSWRPDIVHFMNESNAWLALLVPMLGARPVVTTVHDVYIHPGDVGSARVPRVLTRHLVRMSDAIVVHGENLRSSAIRDLPVTRDRVFVIPHPPLTKYREIANYKKYRKPQDGKFRILFFGRIHQYKGLRYLLEAAPHVQRMVPNIELNIAGTGDDISGDLRKLGDPPFIKVTNRFVPPEQVARLFSESDLLVLPYIEASQSGVLMIAMAFGLPVVATSVGEIPNVIESVDMGIVVPPGNSTMLASAIAQIALDPTLQLRFSTSATRAINGDYSDKSLSSCIFSTYEIILNGLQSVAQTPS